MSEERVVWILDVEGYDARGGNARVFSTKELAKATVPHVKWKQNGAEEYQDVGSSTCDVYVIYPRVVDDPA